MSEKAPPSGVYYSDALVAIVGLLVVIGQVHQHLLGSGTPALSHDTFGVWIPTATMGLWLLFRRKVRVGWPFAVGALMLVQGVAVLYARWSDPPMIAAVGSCLALLAAAVILRARPLSQPLVRLDLFRLMAVETSLCATVVLIEVALRLVPGVFSPELGRSMRADPASYGIANPKIGYLHRPNISTELVSRDFHAVNHVDGLGFPNAWPWPTRADVVAVGDSLTFGYGVADDQAWPAIVAKSLLPSRLVNLGLIGAGPQQYLRLYEEFGLPLQPKLVLVGFFGQNDFWDAGMFDRWSRSGAERNYMVWRDFGRPAHLELSLRHPSESLNSLLQAAAYPVTRYSYLYRLVRALRGSIGEIGQDPPMVTFSDGTRIRLREGQFTSDLALAQPNRHEFQLALDALQRMHVLAGQQKARLLVVLQPGKEEVYLPLLGWGVRETTSPLREALDRLGIEYLDLGPAFRRQAASGERLFFEVDGHPNEAGYALTAKVISAYIKDHPWGHPQAEVAARGSSGD